MKDMNQRLFITIALWLGVALVWYQFMPKQPVARPAASSGPEAGAPAPAPSAASAVPPVKEGDVPRETAARHPTETVALESDRLHILLTSDGAAMADAVLKGDKFTRHKEGNKQQSQVNLVEARAGEPLPLSTIVKGAAGAELVPANASYEVVRHDARSAAFRTQVAGVTVTKTFTLDPATYRLEMGVEVESAAALAGTISVLSASHGEAPAGGFFSSRSHVPARTICMSGSKVERVAVGAKKPIWDGPGAAAFVGIDEQYFLSAVLPPASVQSTCHLEVKPAGSMVATLTTALSVSPGSPTSLAFTTYQGPKDQEELSAVAKPLKESVDLGIWAIIANLLLAVMKFFYKVVPPHNWGLSIILLTVAMKLVTLPLQHKSMKSMQEMQRIQPQLEAMKKKFAGDTQRQNLEQMKLFKEHGVNPMGSCLPMLIQMPIWFALYTTLGVSVELYNSVFIHGWINDLTARDPYFILPVAMGVTMILTQLLTPAPMSNPSQRTMGFAMSGFFALLMFTYPAGLTLYIFTNNLLSIAQQMYIRRALPITPSSASSQTVAVSAKRV
jgi:YidC/Oxa1 family membrane protein insertase